MFTPREGGGAQQGSRLLGRPGDSGSTRGGYLEAGGWVGGESLEGSYVEGQCNMRVMCILGGWGACPWVCADRKSVV